VLAFHIVNEKLVVLNNLLLASMCVLGIQFVL
jgi:hypothetical protein